MKKNSETITDTDETLMARLSQGDADALESLAKRHSRSLYSLALRITADRGDAEEVLQDTFFQLWRKCSQFDSTRGSLIGWLLTIVRRRAISRVRRRSDRFRCTPLRDDVDILPERNGPTLLEHLITRELVSAAFVGLSTDQQDAITLAYFDGWTNEEIAVRTNTSLGTIKTRLRSGLKKMETALSNPVPPVSCKQVQEPATLENILITEQLLSRGFRQRRSHQEEESLHILAEAATPDQLIDAFLRMPLDLCRAGTAGLSLLETTPKREQVFRWTHLAGKLAKYTGGTTPRNFSPCGVTLDCNSPQLFAYPGRYFHYFNDVEVPIVEGLVIPFHVGETEGTIWIVSHEEGLGFDREDVRIMTSLTEFAGCALHLLKLLTAKEQGRNDHPSGAA
jgi:RNA polymerase sigma factor (sigma-70 family)